MLDQNSVSIISGALSSPGSIAPVEQELMAKFRDKYPYFLPARYILAVGKNQPGIATAEALNEIYPYMGNWLQFFSFFKGTPFAKAKEYDVMDDIATEVEPSEYQNYESLSLEIPTVLTVIEEQIINNEQINEENIFPKIAENDINNNDGYVIHEEFVSRGAAPIKESENETLFEIEEISANEHDGETVLQHDVLQEIADYRPAVKDEIDVNEDVALFPPPSSEDYFKQQGIRISVDIPNNFEELKTPYIDYLQQETQKQKSLMVMMSFTEWLLHFRSKSEHQKNEKEEQRAVKAMWQREKLAKALEEEDDEIPEQVFEMAVNSIAKEEGLMSESLAEVYIKQKKYDKAIEMYLKLSLGNPQKNTYFACKIDEILKEKEA